MTCLCVGFSEAYIGSNDAKCSIFLSGQWERVTRLLLIIVSGNGIQPGIWSRSLVMEPQDTTRQYVWEAFAMQARCHQVYIAAYGRGGVLAKHLLLTQPVLRQKLAAIAFIESSHRVSADDPELPDCAQLGCLSLSAGEPQATRLSGEQRSTNTAWTIAASMETVFAFFDSARGYSTIPI
ncbi:hypothetical protein DYB32_002739 [Aphanomyces invadans]|uniref:Uncharacterized protein n=1 Tax=Aphanomyces invadans TaxID=157072 RepID=A0A418B2C0_9STRA|nr:hypothetical protein DYB32_002739 [Aphanomyces invadans]